MSFYEFDEITLDLTHLKWDEKIATEKLSRRKKATIIDDEELYEPTRKTKKQVFKDSITKEQDNLKKLKMIKKSISGGGEKKELGKNGLSKTTKASIDYLHTDEDNFFSALNGLDVNIAKVKQGESKKSSEGSAKSMNGKLEKKTVSKVINDYNNIYPIKPPNGKGLNKSGTHIHMMNGERGKDHRLTNGTKKHDYFIKPEAVSRSKHNSDLTSSQLFTNEISHLELSVINLYCDSIPDGDNKYLKFYKDSYDNVLKEHLFIDPHVRVKFLMEFFNNKKTIDKPIFFLNQKVEAVLEKKNPNNDPIELWKVKLSNESEVYLPTKILHKMINSQDTLPKDYEKLLINN
jgi:hypothetical protein